MILARLLSATPDADGDTWDLQFRGHSDVWHTDNFKLGIAPTPIKKYGPRYRPGAPLPWRPNNLLRPGSIAELNGLYGFDLVANTAKSPTTLDIYGVPPTNSAPTYGSAPQVPLQAAVATTGGSIPTGTYKIAISADIPGPVSILITAVMPAAVTVGTITISGVVWPSGAAPSIALYGGTNSQNLRMLNGVGGGADWTGSNPDANGNPTTFTIQSIPVDGPGLPDPNFAAFMLRAKDIIHGGVWGAAPSSVGATTATFAGASFATNQWAGYTLSSYGIGGGISGSHPFNWLVTSNTADTLTFAAGHPPVGVACVMRAKATSISATTIGDANFVNFYAPGGLTINAEVGNLVRIVAGTGAGQPPIPIQSNTATVLTLASSWYVTPDSTSIYIIEAPAWRYSITTSDSGGTAGLNPILGSIPVLNNFFGSLLVQAVTMDQSGNTSIVRYAPLREIFVPSQSMADPGYFTITPSSGIATIDLANGLQQRIVLATGAAALEIPSIAFTGGTIAPGIQSLSLYLDTDGGVGPWSLPTFDSAVTPNAGTFARDVAQTQIAPIPSTRTSMLLTCHGGPLWCLDIPPRTGGAIS